MITIQKPIKESSVKLKDIRLDAGTQTRAAIDQTTVDDYAERMLEGDGFPPVVVFQVGDEKILADGFHREAAARKAGFKDICAEIRQGNLSDALMFSLRANSGHGLRRSNADKRRAVTMALEKFAELSDRAIAEMCTVSADLVGSLRRPSTVVSDSSPPTARKGLDGKTRSLPPPPLPRSNPPPPPPPPAAKPTPAAPKPAPPEPEVIVDGIGREIPSPLLPLWHRASEAKYFRRLISEVKCAIEKAQNDKDPLWAELNWSETICHLKNAYAQLEVGIPFAVCPSCQGKVFKSCTSCATRGLVSEHRWNVAFPPQLKDMVIKSVASKAA